MAAYDPKRPRPAQLADDPPPVDALIEPVVMDEPAVVDEPTVAAVPAETADAALPERAGTARAADGTRAVDVPVAPAPEVGGANRAVLFASLGVGAVLVAILVVLRRRRRGRTDQ